MICGTTAQAMPLIQFAAIDGLGATRFVDMQSLASRWQGHNTQMHERRSRPKTRLLLGAVLFPLYPFDLRTAGIHFDFELSPCVAVYDV